MRPQLSIFSQIDRNFAAYCMSAASTRPPLVECSEGLDSSGGFHLAELPGSGSSNMKLGALISSGSGRRQISTSLFVPERSFPDIMESETVVLPW